MGKAILVIDMPTRCGECPICASWQPSAFSIREYWCPAMENIDVDPDNKPDWCQLKRVPRMKFTYVNHDDIATTNYNNGWNDCISKILNT